MVSLKNKSSSDKFYIFCLGLSYFGFAIIMYGKPFSDNLISVGTWCIIISCIVGFLYNLLDKDAENSKSISLFFLIFIMIFFLLFLMGAISYTSFVSLICFFEIPFFVTFLSTAKICEVKEIIFPLYYGISWLFIYLSTTNVAHELESIYGTIQIDELTLGYSNPNETGIYLFICLFVLLSGTFYYKNKIIRCVFLLNVFFILYLIIKTKSRACILLALAILAMSIIIKRIRSIKFISKLMIILPLIWIFFVLKFDFKATEITVLGESIETGRAELYIRPFNEMTFTSFFIGDLEKFSFSNMHNAYISIFASVGIVGLASFFIFLYSKIIIPCENFANFSMQEKISCVGVLLCIIHSAVEAAVLVAGSAYAISFVTLYILAFSESNMLVNIDEHDIH